MGTDTLLRAQEALDIARADPRRAVAMATLSGARAIESGDLPAASVSERALGLAAVHIEDLDSAVRHLRRSIELARRASSTRLAAQARVSLAGALSRQGRPAHALLEIDAALPSLAPEHRSRALAQRATVLWHLGRREEALDHFRAALRDMRRVGDLVGVQRVLNNRAVLLIYAGALAAAERDLHESERICDDLDLPLPAANVQENLVLLYRRAGDVPAALQHLATAQRLYEALSVPTGSLSVERSELLLSVGLLAEARLAAEQAVAGLVRVANQLDAPQARLLLARTARLTGQPELALQQAREAAHEFQQQGRVEWAALARLSVLLNMLDTAAAHRVSTPALHRAADEAAASGWVATSIEARLTAGRRGLSTRHDAMAQADLEVVSLGRRRGPAVWRAQGWLAEAMLRRHRGNPPGAAAAAYVGLRVLHEHRATMTATDLRAHVAGLGSDLARLGVGVALEGGSAYQVLRWAEVGRARHLIERPARPPADRALAQRLAELRSVVAELELQRRVLGPTAALLARQVRLEHSIRDRIRTQRATQGSARSWTSPPGARQLTDQLAGAVLVEFVVHDDCLYAVTLSTGRPRLTPLGPVAPVRELVRWLLFGLHRLARSSSQESSRAAAVALLRNVGRRLDEALFGPLRRVLGDRDLVLVPTGDLQSLPWSLLPSLSGRPVTVAPSAALWLTATTAAVPSGSDDPGAPAVVVAGPGLQGAEQEAVEVADIYGVKPLLDGDANVEAVTGAIAGAGVAHLATHGTLRADNALFSSLRLSDGPLTVYDLEALDVAPDTVVLAACDSGRSVVLAGDELLGLSAAFLSRGTRHLIASVVPVPDVATAPLMVHFHRLLASGSAVAEALARAQAALTATEEPMAFAAAAGFVCLGAGFSAITAPQRRLVDAGRPVAVG